MYIFCVNSNRKYKSQNDDESCCFGFFGFSDIRRYKPINKETKIDTVYIKLIVFI